VVASPSEPVETDCTPIDALSVSVTFDPGRRSRRAGDAEGGCTAVLEGRIEIESMSRFELRERNVGWHRSERFAPLMVTLASVPVVLGVAMAKMPETVVTGRNCDEAVGRALEAVAGGDRGADAGRLLDGLTAATTERRWCPRRRKLPGAGVARDFDGHGVAGNGGAGVTDLRGRGDQRTLHDDRRGGASSSRERRPWSVFDARCDGHRGSRRAGRCLGHDREGSVYTAPPLPATP